MKHTKLICALAGFALFGLSTLTYGAPPLAGTPIGNQAKATFTDESNVEREVFSNVVITRVSEVYAVNLEQPTDRIATPGSQVYFPHTVFNEGNALDSFNLSTALTGATELLNVFIYPDTNRDGHPDSQTPITVTPAITPGESYSFVVAGIVPPTAGIGATGGVDVTATSVEDAGVSDMNADTFTITSDAVMQVTKAVDKGTGTPPVDGVGGVGEITYTITYTNTGNTAATGFTIKDVIPTGMTYIPDSARWHRSGNEVLTDAAGGDPAGISYTFGDVPNQATFVIDTVERRRPRPACPVISAIKCGSKYRTWAGTSSWARGRCAAAASSARFRSSSRRAASALASSSRRRRSRSRASRSSAAFRAFRSAASASR